ncbi:MAG: 4Fe-4S binding protein, partial [Gammaproteobacteria bacterium]|nr:4Fe-4S binding protein [Gammaproteobacteria bacterium]
VLINNNGDCIDIKSLPENIPAGYGTLSRLSGHLGEYTAEIKLKDEVVNLAKIHFPKRNAFDMVIDLSDEPVFTNSLLPFGYFSPKNDQELDEVIGSIPDMIGEFEKPKFFDYNPDICAHGNSGLEACQRCINVCPADAITSIKDAIEVDPYLCQGGGACATVCPTGAIQYVFPRLQDTLEKLRCMLKAYYATGGHQAAIVFYGENETELLQQQQLSDYIPFQLEETASVGMDVWLPAFAYGAHEVMLLTHENTASEVIDAIDIQLTYAHAIITGMGFDPSCLHRQSINNSSVPAINKRSDSFSVVTPSKFMALNDKRAAVRMATDHLYLFAPTPHETVSLPAGAPFGEVQVNKDNCTLCMACVSVCPASALADGFELPQLRFSEANCVQCGLCSKACPELALTLSSRYNYVADIKRKKRILHEDEPFCCVSCRKPFATHSLIENITAKLSKHHMFQTEEAINRLKMCEDCRVRDMFSSELEIRH